METALELKVAVSAIAGFAPAAPVEIVSSSTGAEVAAPAAGGEGCQGHEAHGCLSGCAGECTGSHDRSFRDDRESAASLKRSPAIASVTGDPANPYTLLSAIFESLQIAYVNLPKPLTA